MVKLPFIKRVHKKKRRNCRSNKYVLFAPVMVMRHSACLKLNKAKPKVFVPTALFNAMAAIGGAAIKAGQTIFAGRLRPALLLHYNIRVCLKQHNNNALTAPLERYSMIKKHGLTKFFTLYFGFVLASNFVHPVTPAFLQLIQCPSSMFGFAFAAMALAQFLTSSLWGKLGDKFGYIRCIGFCYFGYGVSAIVFSAATGWPLVLVARFLAGMFIAGVTVNSMAYLTALAAPAEERNKLLVIYASMASIGGAFGFLIGGLIGDISIFYSFYTQAASLFICGGLMLFLVREHSHFEQGAAPLKLKDVNPFASLAASAKMLNVTVSIFLVSVFFAFFAATGFDQNFNYYMRVKLNFAPSSSGMFKAVVGIVSLFANLTISMWVVRKANISKAMAMALLLCGGGITCMVMAGTTTGLMGAALCYYALMAIVMPLQQSVMLKNDSGSTKGAVAGLFNATRAAGMVVGPTFAGLVFDINPDYAFLTFAFAMALSAAVTYINYLQLKKSGIY